MRDLLLSTAKWYISRFPVRKGKIPLVKVLDSMGLTKGVTKTGLYDQDLTVHLNLEDWIQKQIYFFGYYAIEKKETDFWKQLIKPGMVVFDIGANIGYYALMAAKRVGKEGAVYAFEPVSFTFQKLKRHVEENNLTSAHPYRIALSDHQGKLKMFVASETNTGSSSIFKDRSSSGKEEEVECMTVDTFAQQQGISRIDVVKIDVEGSEPFVLRGMTGTIQRYHPLILIEVADRRLGQIEDGRKGIYETLLGFGYQAFEIKSGASVRALNAPLEGSLIAFKHASQPWPAEVSVTA